MKNILILILLAGFYQQVDGAYAIDVGQMAPSFELKAFGNGQVKLESFRNKIVVLEWFNPACVGTNKYYEPGLTQRMQEEYVKRGIVWLTISSTNPQGEGYVTEKNAPGIIKGKKVKSSYVLDDSKGVVGRLYDATTTPNFVVIDIDGRIAYYGGAHEDLGWFTDPDPDKDLVRAALNALLERREIEVPHVQAIGCPILYAE